MFVLAGIASGVLREAGGQLFNSGCWVSVGDVRLGDCETSPPTDSTGQGVDPSTPTGPASPGPSPSSRVLTAMDFLLSHVPGPIRETCKPTSLAGAVSAVACEGGDPMGRVTYRRFSTTAQAVAAYLAQFPDDFTSFGDCSIGASDVATAKGRLGCYDSPVLGRIIVWTDDPLKMIVQARTEKASYRDLAAWAATAGPLP